MALTTLLRKKNIFLFYSFNHSELSSGVDKTSYYLYIFSYFLKRRFGAFRIQKIGLRRIIAIKVVLK